MTTVYDHTTQVGLAYRPKNTAGYIQAASDATETAAKQRFYYDQLFDGRFYSTVNDGVTDNGTALRNLITAAVAGGGGNGARAYLCPGTYKTTKNPFGAVLGGGTRAVVLEFEAGAKIHTSVQIRVPNGSRMEGACRLRSGIELDSSFIASVAISTIARAANIVTVTTSGPHGLEVGAQAVITGCATTSFNGAWTVVSTPTATSYTFAQTAGNANDSTGTVFIPAVVEGDTEPFSLGVRCDNMMIDCNSVANSVGIFSSCINEQSGGEHLSIINVGKYGIWIEQDGNSAGVPNNYRFCNIEILPLPSVGAKGIYGRAATTGQHRGFEHITVVPTGAGGVDKLAAGIDISGFSGEYGPLHFEGTTDGLLIGARLGSDANADAGASSAGIEAGPITGNFTVTNLVRIANGAECHDIKLKALTKRGGTNILKDDVRGKTFTSKYMAEYVVGGAGALNHYGSESTDDWRVDSSLRARLGFFLGTTNVFVVVGNGSPEGSVVGDIGALYLRLDGGAGTTLYVKQSNSGGNTGWVGK